MTHSRSRAQQIAKHADPLMAWLRFGETHVFEPGKGNPDRCRLCDWGPKHLMHGTALKGKPM